MIVKVYIHPRQYSKKLINIDGLFQHYYALHFLGPDVNPFFDTMAPCTKSNVKGLSKCWSIPITDSMSSFSI